MKCSILDTPRRKMINTTWNCAFTSTVSPSSHSQFKYYVIYIFPVFFGTNSGHKFCEMWIQPWSVPSIINANTLWDRRWDWSKFSIKHVLFKRKNFTSTFENLKVQVPSRERDGERENFKRNRYLYTYLHTYMYYTLFSAPPHY